MALRSQTVSIPLDQGLDTKSDKKLLPPGKLWLLENAVRKKTGKIQKRNGCTKLGDGIVNSASVLEDADALGTFNDELLQFNKQSLYSYSEQADRWVDKGAAISAKVRSRDLSKNNYEQTQVDMAVVGNIALTAWEDSRGGIRCTVHDIESGTQMLVDTSVHASASRPRCVAFGANLYVLYVVTNDLRGRRLNPKNPVLETEVVISSAVNSSNVHHDAVAQPNHITVAYNVQGASQIRLHNLNENLAVQSTVNIGEAATSCVSIVQGPESKVFVLWCNGSGVRGAIHNVFLASLVAPFDVDAAITTAEVITGYELPDETGVRVFFQVNAAASYNHYTKQAKIVPDGTVSGLAVFLRSVGIAAKAFAYSPDTTDRGFLPLVHESTLQSTFFVARNDGYIVAKIQPGVAGGLLSRTLPATVSQRETGIFTFPILTKNPIIEATDKSFLSFKGVSVTEVDFTDQSNFFSVQGGENAYINGGVVSMYDGVSAVEDNFHLFPENITLAQSTDGAGQLTTTGTYQVVGVYEWTDALGQIHRSTPSVPVTIVLTGSNNRITATFPTLRLTAKKGTRAPVSLVLYRTQDLGSQFFRASSPTSLTLNDTTVDSVTIVDDLSDANLQLREPLYTTGDILENIAPPAASIVLEWDQRIALLGLEDDSALISKIRQQGSPIAFAAEFGVVIPKKGGRTTAAAILDDKLIIFKEASIGYIYGDGPDDLGNGRWSTPVFLPGDVGCIDANSVEQTPVGIVFKSRKGIYLLKSDLTVQYIGAEVEDWNDEVITSAVVLADENELRFTTLEGPTLVYNYFYGLWGTFPRTSATDAVIWKNEFVYIRRLLDGPAVVAKEAAGFFQDIDQQFSQRIGIGWLSFAGIAGFQRIRRVGLLGEYKSPHKLKVSFAYNFSNSYHEVHEWDATSYNESEAYGEEEVYGGEGVYGGTDVPYLPRLGPAQQKSTALSMLIEDTKLDGTFESFDLSALVFEVGVKKGIYKTPAEASL